MLKWIVNLTALICLAGAGIGLSVHLNQETESEHRAAQTAYAVEVITQVVDLQAVKTSTQTSISGWPEKIDPAWFDSQKGVPRNALVDEADARAGVPGRPWVDVAGPAEAGLHHPRIRQTVNGQLAMFWYNPALGVVRARVPVLVSDSDATDLYNEVNRTRLVSLFAVECAGN
ncbi:MAG: hypothetical protein LW650_13980 [Planctomycetaceae bacterium]|jgi:hypothetical protein|nr:hypothetical protein [Phycisphaerales bacterium]MCE2654508.1 hypothetical protein [Planctomycetaceae bacterium]